MKVTEAKFLKYQAIFNQHVEESDMILEVGFNKIPNQSGDFLRDFTGSNAREETVWHSFHALYETNIATYIRDKVGMTAAHESGAIYLSPLQLIPIFGSFVIDKKTTIFRKSGHLFLPDSIQYLEPLYDTCIAVEIRLREYILG